jgi:hypothetical protein
MSAIDHRLSRATRFLLTIFALLVVSTSAFSAGGTCPSGVPATTCYFISATGSDTNSGTSESSPWLHAPGMPSCSGACAAAQTAFGPAKTADPGVGLIFRGGDTWHEGNSSANPSTGGTFNIMWGGSPSSCQYEGTQSGCFYVGVDKSWYNSSVCGSSWCRPILNGDNPPSTSPVASCAYQTGQSNQLFILSDNENTDVYFDGFELTGFCAKNTSPPATDNTYIVDAGTGVSGGGMNFLNDLYLHGWTITTGTKSNTAIPCILIGGGSQGLDSITQLVVDGSDSVHGGCAFAQFPSFYHFKDSIVRYTTYGVGQWCHDIHDVVFEDWFAPTYGESNGSGSWTSHPNTLECNDDADGSAPNQPQNTPNVFYNNIVRHDEPSQAGAGPVHLWFCPESVPEYWFNNLMYDLTGGNFWDYAGPSGYGCSNTGGQHMFNNTLVDVVQPCYVSTVNHGGQYLTVLNELLINTPFDNGSTPCNGYGDASNVTMSDSTATSQGYTTGSSGTAGTGNTCAQDSTTPCAPTASSAGTVGKATNEQAYCTALASYSSEYAISTEAANACKYGTTDACSYNTTTHAMNCPAQTPAARPASSAWDAGAYEFGSSGDPLPPTDLQATPH